MRKKFHFKNARVLWLSLFSIIIYTAPVYAQVPSEAEIKGTTYWAACCRCDNGYVLIDKKPRMPGRCRECNLLCGNCQKELGGLDKALEELKQKNRDLNDQFQKKTSELQRWNQRFYDKCIETFGKEREDGGWTLDGLNGSFGTFFTSLLSVSSNFAGPAPLAWAGYVPSPGRVIPVTKQWVATGLTVVTHGMGIYQTVYDTSKPESYADYMDNATNYGSIVNDYLSSEFTNWIADKIDDAKMIRDISAGGSAESFYYRSVYHIPTPPRLSETHLNALEGFGLFADLWGLGRATQDLIDKLADVGIAWENASALEKELEKIQEEIEKNNKLMDCIRETQEFNEGKGSFYKRKADYFSDAFAISFLSPAVLSNFYALEPLLVPNDLNNFKISLDLARLKSSISKLKQLISEKNEMISYTEKNIIPNFLPWITNTSNRFKRAILVKLLKKNKIAYPVLFRKCEEMAYLGESIRDELRYAFIIESQLSDGSGNITNSPLSEYQDGSFYIAGRVNDSMITTNDNWSIINNKKIPAGKGRLFLEFPANVEWSVDIYTAEDRFYTNRSSYSKHRSYDLPPGTYNLKLHSIPVQNVSFSEKKETKLKVGILNIVTKGHWELYDASRNKYYSSNLRPGKFLLPVGTYTLNFEGKDYKITIRNGMILKFDLKKPLFIDK